jgi:hypothetical protein
MNFKQTVLNITEMRKFLLLLLFFNLNICAYNQVIKGTVCDQNTKSPIYSASIYFNGTSAGTLSDQNGNFEMDVSKYIYMPLTISALGYFSVTLTDFTRIKPLHIYLKPKLFELNEVVVNAKSHARERRANLLIFKNEFLGTTVNAMDCEITNEDDIKFIYNNDNDTIRAYANKPILIENKALGYKIAYYLDKFEYCKEDASFSFKGNIIFTEDLASDETKKKSYDRKRKTAYLGSRMHFFRALWIDELNSAGFTVKNSANETLKYNKIVIQADSHTKYLSYPDNLGIAYYSTKVPTSFIIFLKDKVYFDANGYFDPSGIRWEGNMAQKRVADMLPYDYIVSNN